MNFLCVAVLLSVPWILGTALVVTGVDFGGAAVSNATVELVVKLTLVYAVGLPLVAGVVLPRLGLDWDPTGYGIGTWLLLVVGAVVYSLSFAVPLFGIAVILALPT